MKFTKGKRVHGLKSATLEEIAELKLKYPRGRHITHSSNGDKLPYNGVFYEYGK